MSIKLLIVILISQLLCFTFCTFNITCGDYTCLNLNSTCLVDNINKENKTCICSDQFATFPQNSLIQCNYQRKSQMTAFLLEFFITFGAGHFYVEFYQFAVPKMFFWIIGLFLFIAYRIISKQNNTDEDDEDNADTTNLILALISCIFCYGMLVWQIADVILFGVNYYTDGNLIGLHAWNN